MKSLPLPLTIVLIAAMFLAAGATQATAGEPDPSAKTFTAWGTSYYDAWKKTLQEAGDYYGGMPYRITDVLDEWDPTHYPAHEQYKITIWTMP